MFTSYPPFGITHRRVHTRRVDAVSLGIEAQLEGALDRERLSMDDRTGSRVEVARAWCTTCTPGYIKDRGRGPTQGSLPRDHCRPSQPLVWLLVHAHEGEDAMTLTFGRAAFAFLVAVSLPLSLTGRTETDRQDPAPSVAQEARLDPIPTINHPVASEEVLRRVYEFAARNEHIVKYVPCFCGCEQLKHESVESCFISARTPDGRVTWNRHGAGCPLCVDVMDAARELHAQGHSVADIRRLVVERFYKTRITPTPDVPPQHHHGH